MKRIKTGLFFIIMLLFFLSCTERERKAYIIAGNDYKLWQEKKAYILAGNLNQVWQNTALTSYYHKYWYFDKFGHFDAYENIPKGFQRCYGPEAVTQDGAWRMVNDSIIHFLDGEWKICYLDDRTFIFKQGALADTLLAVPKTTIPINTNRKRLALYLKGASRYKAIRYNSLLHIYQVSNSPDKEISWQPFMLKDEPNVITPIYSFIHKSMIKKLFTFLGY
jgi:hypothetical protein